MNDLRTERSHGLTEQLTGTDRAALVQIAHSDGYRVLLDIMEMCCIEQETNLINCHVDEQERILAEHRYSKAMWQMFTGLQKKVNAQIAMHLNIVEDARAEQEEAAQYDPEQAILRPFDSRNL